MIAVALSVLLDRALLDEYAYNGTAARQVYSQAAAAYPDSAMAYWGEALALGPDINFPQTQEHFLEAQPLIAKAAMLASTATPRDRLLIAAMTLRYAGPWSHHGAGEAAYRAAMAQVAAAYPADDDVQMLYAEALAENDDWAKVAALAATVLARDPQHPMANHLCIHADDDAPDRTAAVACAERLDAMTFAPEQEHLAHMPAHAWIETGDYARAVASSERGYDLAMRLAAMPNATAVYGGHDAQVGFSAAMMLRDEKQAMIWADRAKGGNRPKSRASLVYVRFGMWNEILHDRTAGDPAHAAALALAHAQTGDIALARSTYSELTHDQKTSAIGVLAKARIDELGGNIPAAAHALRALANKQYLEFTAEYLPALPAIEALGELYLRAGASAKAIAAFGEALRHYPRDPRALDGLSVARRRAG